MARNDFRGDPGFSARSRRAAQSAQRGPSSMSGGFVTTTLLTPAIDADTGLWTLNLGIQSGEIAPVADNVTIAAIYAPPGGDNIRRLYLGANNILLNSASFVLPGDDNVESFKGDVAEFYYDPVNTRWICFSYTRGGIPSTGIYNSILAWACTNPAGIGTEGVDFTYNNGTDGIGATITFAANGSQTIDGAVPGVTSLTNIVLVTDFPQPYAGIYAVTTKGTASVQEVWTRSTLLDSAIKFEQGVLVYVLNGLTCANTVWAMFATGNTFIVGDAVFGIPSIQSLAFPLLPTVNPPAGNIVVSNGTIWTGSTMDGDMTLAYNGGTGNTDATLASTITAGGPTGGATTVPIITWDAKGRLTAVSSTTITGVSPVGSALTSARIWVGSAANVAAAVAMSGDVTISNTGVTAIGSLKVTTAMIAANAVTSAKVDSTVIIAAGSNAFSGDQSMGSHKLTNVTDPASAQDAATKNYVDTQLQNISAKKECKAATTVALTELSYTNNGGVGDLLTIAVGVLLIDGQSLAVSDRILVKNQAAPAHNGVYAVQTVGTAIISPVFIRATDFDQAEDGIDGALVYVLSGTTLANTLWFCTTGATITWGTTSINWSQFTGTTYTADESTLHLSGTTFSILSTYTGQTSITTLGTITTGTWHGTVITGTYGGTGVNNGASTITVGGNVAFSGAFATTVTVTGTTAITLPTGGTLVNTAVTTLSSLVSIGTVTTGTWQATIIDTARGGTGVDNSTGGTANQFWARPDGATGAASYRVITVGDLPAFTGLTAADCALTDAAVYYNAAATANRKVTVQRLLGFADSSVCDGRLTLTSGTAATTASVTGATTIYFTPYIGDRLTVYDGTRLNLYVFTEISLALGTLVNAQAYDVYVYDNSGTLTLEALEWANSTITSTSATPAVITWTTHGMVTGNSVTFTNSGGALPAGISANTQYWITKVDASTFKISTSMANVAAGTFVNTTTTGTGTHTGHQPQARATALVQQNGAWYKTGALTRRYLGTFFTSATTTTEDSTANRFLFNAHNRLQRILQVVEATASWNYTTATWRQARATDTNRVNFIYGLAERPVNATVHCPAGNASGVNGAVGIGINSTNTNSAIVFGHIIPATAVAIECRYEGYPAVGFNSLVWLEISQAIGTTTFYGTNSLAYVQAGMVALTWG